MKRTRFTEEQIIGVLKEHEAGIPIADLCRKHGVSIGEGRRNQGRLCSWMRSCKHSMP